MENKERLELIKSLQRELQNLEEGKKKIVSLIKEKKELLEDITNNVINALLKEENEKKRN